MNRGGTSPLKSGGGTYNSQVDLHEKREVPRYDLSGHPDGLVSGVAVVVAVQRDHLPVVLVRPPREVAVALDTRQRRGQPGT